MTPSELRQLSQSAIEYQRALAFVSLNPATEEALKNAMRVMAADVERYLRRDEHVDFFI